MIELYNYLFQIPTKLIEDEWNEENFDLIKKKLLEKPKAKRKNTRKRLFNLINQLCKD